MRIEILCNHPIEVDSKKTARVEMGRSCAKHYSSSIINDDNSFGRLEMYRLFCAVISPFAIDHSYIE
jgi:hypothetical protein